MTSQQDSVAGSRNPYVALYAQRIDVQGAGHPDTAATLLNLLRHGLSHSVGQDATAANRPLPSNLPPGTGPDGVRLDEDHVDLLAEALERAVALQEEETTSHGPDHPRALLATCLLAHALAAADQLDGQLEAAQVLIDDAHDGLVELAMSPGAVDPDAVRISEALHGWIHGRIEDGDDESDE
ncbi:hypothetical protein [Streptomyces sp. MBT33]|uniref:hypothetical protein n=1 Tax=Streptomyces sp. MBT33 TaxID=1488363 RepID=UPI00190DE1E2|nr:hypothetical protein [Streptomyces sp. MBT33]MBK3644589.1 hypothetical protein [Streptomyces sp. MBT33]